MSSLNETRPLLSSPKRGISLNCRSCAYLIYFQTRSIILITLGYVLSGIIAWWIASPTSLVGGALESFFTFFGLISDRRALESCSHLYAFFAYALTPANSIVGVALGTAGYTHGDPRHAKLFLTGLPARLTASHQNLLETFPIYALVAALTALLGPRSLSAPTVPLYDHAVNLLALHVFCKTILYIPAHLKDLGKLRSATHFLGIGALLAVLYQLTFSTY